MARKKVADSRRPNGYTLVELLVVLAILGLLVALAAPRVIKYLGSAKTDTARIQIEKLGGVLDLYRLEIGRYPTEQEGLESLVDRPPQLDAWNGPYLKNRDALTDPWGRPYGYQSPGEHGDYDLYTLGADGKEGGDGEAAALPAEEAGGEHDAQGLEGDRDRADGDGDGDAECGDERGEHGDECEVARGEAPVADVGRHGGGHGWFPSGRCGERITVHCPSWGVSAEEAGRTEESGTDL